MRLSTENRRQPLSAADPDVQEAWRGAGATQMDVSCAPQEMSAKANWLVQVTRFWPARLDLMS